jgi:hypothetical protein
MSLARERTIGNLIGVARRCGSDAIMHAGRGPAHSCTVATECRLHLERRSQVDAGHTGLKRRSQRRVPGYEETEQHYGDPAGESQRPSLRFTKVHGTFHARPLIANGQRGDGILGTSALNGDHLAISRQTDARRK